jgi:hypothetical protein
MAQAMWASDLDALKNAQRREYRDFVQQLFDECLVYGKKQAFKDIDATSVILGVIDLLELRAEGMSKELKELQTELSKQPDQPESPAVVVADEKEVSVDSVSY